MKAFLNFFPSDFTRMIPYTHLNIYKKSLTLKIFKILGFTSLNCEKEVNLIHLMQREPCDTLLLLRKRRYKQNPKILLRFKKY